jgi:hypothetical protein
MGSSERRIGLKPITFHFSRRHAALENALVSLHGTVLRVAVTFFVTICTMAVFRSTSLADTATLFRRMFTPSAGPPTPAPAGILVFAVVVTFLIPWIAHQGWFRRLRRHAPESALGFGYCAMLVAALLLAPKGGQAFVYFQF